ncbi:MULTISPECIES: winged helix DNA-binding domain-containing protein [unclassified Streptomyces]|uniref:winged helix DNA-binding domain-containing protein n=1 Tax=unclassified Streptomyces TaxID=2593676 RepID=UPI00037E4634|nr:MULTISPECIES: winged helix DNA-binding domain-containing protein [unclassified Streptomyces]MYX37506.1 winged helix DNA-binding domain-containing protein [Streptomyces sp. SID8377]
MDTRRTVGAEERRRRLAVRHRLTAQRRAAAPEEVAESLVALHGTDPATVYLSAAARMRAPGAAALDRALYEEGSLTRLLAMRRTMFVVATASAPVVLSAAALAIAAQERRKLLGYLADGGGWDEEWLARLEESVLDALAVRGEATAAQLASDVPGLREQVVVARGKPYEATQAVSTRVLRVLAAEGRIVRRRPLGGWTSSQYRWAPGAVTQAPPAPEARVELVRRWLAAYGPGTEADLKWWTGWTLTEVRRALTVIGTEQVLIDGETGHVLPDDAGPVPATPPWAALLPALDPTPMGWQRREWYLPADGRERAALFDRSGNIGPTVWWNGRVVGGWAQRADGEVVHRLFADPGREAVAAIGAEAARLGGWLDGVRVTPRFRTPLERELSGSPAPAA